MMRLLRSEWCRSPMLLVLRKFLCSTCAIGLSSSCGFHAVNSFRVIPANPAYLLRSPDRRKTPFPEVLKNYNGFELGKGWINLRPLMQVRVENAYYEQGSSRKGLDGFLGTEIARYDVTEKGLRLTSVQSMVNRPQGDPPVDDLIPVDVQKALQHRLYFEIVFEAGGRTHSSVLLSADTPAEIERLAAQLDHPEALCAHEPAHCTVFPDACSVSVEMQIVVNGQRKSLAWGTLLSSLTSSHPIHSIAVKRLYSGRLIPIAMNHDDPAALRFPLLPGDEISWK